MYSVGAYSAVTVGMKSAARMRTSAIVERQSFFYMSAPPNEFCYKEQTVHANESALYDSIIPFALRHYFPMDSTDAENGGSTLKSCGLRVAFAGES